MLKLLFWVIKKIVLASLLIYSFDVFAVSLGVSIPINVITVFLVSVFDFSALFCLILFSFVFNG